MLNKALFTIFTAVLILLGTTVHAQSVKLTLTRQLLSDNESSNKAMTDTYTVDGIVIEGDKLELYLDRRMRATGNAIIRRDAQDIFGDVIEYDMQNDALMVEGNAKIESTDATITGPLLNMRLSENIGDMKKAKILIKKFAQNLMPQATKVGSEAFSKSLGNVQSQQVGDGDALNNQHTGLFNENETQALTTSVRADADHLYIEGPNQKRLKKARFTTCVTGVDDWYIKANEIELNNFSSTGTAEHAYVEFKGVPILYTPWIGFSFNNQRKSGFLAPIVGSTSRSGFEAASAYYLNISPNMDATVGTRALSRRGLQFQGEFRYLEENFSGMNNFEYLPNDTLTGTNRFYANFKHQHRFGNGWSAGYSLERVSDNEYFSELSTRIVTTSRINLPQQFNVGYSDDIWDFQAIAQKFQTLIDGFSPYERLPQMSLSGNKFFGNLNTNVNSQLVSFQTNINSPNIPTGMRAMVNPSISYAFTKSYGFITPKVGVHHTSYNLDNVPESLSTQSRTLPIASVDSGLFFDRDFAVGSRKYLQTFEPRLFYVYVPVRDQSNIPIFDTSIVDLNFNSLFTENQFTGNDRINDANQASIALTTRLIDAETGVQRLSASIGQRYFLSQQQVTIPGTRNRDSNSSDILLGLSANLKNNWNLDALWQYNTDNSEAVRTTFTGRYNPSPGKTLNLSYSYRQVLGNQINPIIPQFDLRGNRINGDINQFNISGQWPLWKGWYGVGRINYSIEDKQFIETLGGLEYNAGCWSTRVVAQRVTTARLNANNNTAIFFQLELGGLASIGANPLAVIQRNVPGYVSSNLIPETTQQSYYE